MALQVRRGTNAQRLQLNGVASPLPLAGELIYATDTNQLYVGDGSTTGGTLIEGAGSTTLAGLTDVDVTGATSGQILAYNTGTLKWSPIGVAAAGGVIEGSNYRISIVSDDSTVIVNAATGIVTGDLVGNSAGVHTGDHIGSVFADDNTTMVDGINNIISNGEVSLDQNEILTISGILQLGNNTNALDSVDIKSDVVAVIRSEYDGSADILSTMVVAGSRGTRSIPTTLQVGDFIGNYILSGHDGAAYTPKALILGQIDAVTDTNLLPGKLIFSLHGADGTYTSGVSINSRDHVEAPVMKFTPYADATARDTALPGGIVEAGMVIYLASTNKLQVNTDSTITGWIDLN